MSSRPLPARSNLDVLLAGMVFLDIVFTDLPSAPHPGHEVWAGGMGSSPGGIANLALATARLDLHTSLVAAFSDDGYGAWCRDVLARQERVDLSRSRTFPDWHSPVTVSLAYDGDRAMVTHGHPAPLSAAELLGDPPATRAVITDLNDEPWWRSCQAAGALVFADIGWDPDQAWDTERSPPGRVPRLHAQRAGGHGLHPHHRAPRPPSVPSPTRCRWPSSPADQRATAIDQSTGESADVAALDVPAIDPTGAGDVFGAALVVGTLDGWPLVERLRFATLAAALAVQQFGGGLAAPGWGDIADWWTRARLAARCGGSEAARLEADYSFLTDLLARHEGRAVRRANATIARLSDIEEPAAVVPRRKHHRRHHD